MAKQKRKNNKGKKMSKGTAGNDKMTLNASEAAKLLNVSTETIRKWASQGKVPGTKDAAGRWMFSRDSLFPATKNVTKVIFVIDRSGSMQGLEPNMRAAIEAQMSEFRGASDAGNQYDVGFITFSTDIDTFAGYKDARNANAPSFFGAGGTALRDAMANAIDESSKTMALDRSAATLLVLITDGEENSSSIDERTLKARIANASATGRFTVVANCPPGHERYFESLGVPAGNVKAWTGSAEGIRTLSAANNIATRSYTALRATGQTVSSTFYAQPVTTDADKFAKQLDNSMDDVTSKISVARVTAKDPVVIKDFCTKKFGDFTKGQFCYELTKSEKVQDYKQIVVQDSATGKFFAGWDAARRLLGLPQNQVGTIKIKPGSMGDFKVFVQSTSVNRKLVPGTAVVRL